MGQVVAMLFNRLLIMLIINDLGENPKSVSLIPNLLIVRGMRDADVSRL